MARCPNCNMFAAYDEQTPEVQSLEVYDDGTVTAEVRVVLGCATCGTELRETTLELQADVELPEAWTDDDGALCDGYVLEVSEDGVEFTSRSDGKPDTPSRFRRTFYGARVEATVCCEDARGKAVGEPISVTLEGDEQASSFEDMT